MSQLVMRQQAKLGSNPPRIPTMTDYNSGGALAIFLVANFIKK